MMSGMMSIKNHNNFIQNLYKINTKFRLHLHEKTNTKLRLQIQELMI